MNPIVLFSVFLILIQSPSESRCTTSTFNLHISLYLLISEVLTTSKLFDISRSAIQWFWIGYGNIFTRNSLVSLNFGLFICRFSSISFHLDQKRVGCTFVLFGTCDSLIPSNTMIAPRTPFNIAFPRWPPGLTLFSQPSTELGYHAGNKTWAWSQGCCVTPGLLALDGSSCILPLRVPCCHFFPPHKFTYPAPSFPSFGCIPSTAMTVSWKP